MTTPKRAKPAPKSAKTKTKTVSGGAKARTGAPRSSSGAKTAASANDATRLIDQRIRELADWRGETLARMRKLIHAADPAVTEEWKWMGTPVWSHDGILCTGETYTKVVKLTFARGAALADPSRLFNSSLEGNTRRAIDIREGETVDARAFRALVQAAVALNTQSAQQRSPRKR